MREFASVSAQFPFVEDRIAWPDEAAIRLKLTQNGNHLRRAILYQRLRQYVMSEAELISSLQSKSKSEEVSLALEMLNELRLAQPMQVLPELHKLQKILESGDQAKVIKLIEKWPPHLNCAEALELFSRALKSLGRYGEASAVLSDVLSRSCGSPMALVAVLEINYLRGSSNGFALATSTRLYPRDPNLSSHRVLIELHERQSGIARRSAFRERLLYSLGKKCHSYHQSHANLLYCYDQTGLATLGPYLHGSVRSHLKDSPPLHANLIMQLASIASPLYGEYAHAHAKSFPKCQTLPKYHRNRRLKVGLISPDFYYHPVGRFIQMLLSVGFGQEGELCLISTGKNGLPKLAEFVGKRYFDFSCLTRDQSLEQVRNLELDVAVDLAGWTGENNGFLFASRLAPLQVNYLGFFASTGLPAMDVWLGDSALFPDLMQEWHSERIVRLTRPFLAWQPDESLPEGRVKVPPAPTGAITFGCFNHVRKLSSPTLRLWGKLLQSIPGARLALKAFSTDDLAVVALLKRRMRRCGLNPELVIWLPTSPKPEDHLRQYGLVDIALDPFPNGGCTTTCEALWMGVPVITLCGTHYVSRMATAVLQGANLGEWVAHTEEEYLHLGIQAAKRLQVIRAGREQLRVHLQASPLGDAADLARQLWRCFEQLAHEHQPC